VQRTVDAGGHSVCIELMGHGIGRRLHEPPEVPNYPAPGAWRPLTEGLVLTIEPIVSAGTGAIIVGDDGWTVRTADGALAAHVCVAAFAPSSVRLALPACPVRNPYCDTGYSGTLIFARMTSHRISIGLR